MGLHLYERRQHVSARGASSSSRPNGTRYVTTLDGDELLLQAVHATKSTRKSRWRLHEQTDILELGWLDSCSGKPEVTELLAAIETGFFHYPHRDSLVLRCPLNQTEALIRAGLVFRRENGQLAVSSELFWQQARMWLSSALPAPFPLTYVFTEGRRHPLRPPKPAGTVYERHIPWLDRTLSFRTVNLQRDLERFSHWMNDPVVAASWREEGDLAKHRDYLRNIVADPHVTGLIACLDHEAFGYFEVYWAKEDRIAPFYGVDDYDRGWHVLIGEPHFRGKPFVTAWLPSISHYLFLDDCRTRRLIIEPRSDNYKMIRNLAKCGYANLKEFDFPHKRATLCMLLRERFFSERLWIPRDVLVPSLSTSLS